MVVLLFRERRNTFNGQCCTAAVSLPSQRHAPRLDRPLLAHKSMERFEIGVSDVGLVSKFKIQMKIENPDSANMLLSTVVIVVSSPSS